MMRVAGLWTAHIGYRDREDTIAYMDLCFDNSTDVQGTLDWLATDARFQAITDAVRFCAQLEQFVYLDSNPASTLALVSATFIFSTDDPNEYGILDIPGATFSVAMTSGCFTGHAIDCTRSEVLALAELITADPPLVTPSGKPYRTLVAAGYRQIWRDIDRRSG